MTIEAFIPENEQVFFLNKWKKIMPNVAAGFTSKNGGVSKGPFSSLNLGLHVNDDLQAVTKNRDKLAQLLNFETTNWVCSEQIHDNHIQKVTTDDLGKGVYNYSESIKNTDGVYTTEQNILLTSCYADCVPLFFLSAKHQIIGVAHAGWKGSVKDIAGNMVRTWKEKEGIAPSDIYVAIGPAIEECCYVVDDRVIDHVNNVVVARENYPYRKVSDRQYELNLKQLNHYLLLQAGVPKENITVSSYCTSCEDNLFFSHRRDNGKTGRMLSFIGMKP